VMIAVKLDGPLMLGGLHVGRPYIEDLILDDDIKVLSSSIL
jgi:hypothetical protein